MSLKTGLLLTSLLAVIIGLGIRLNYVSNQLTLTKSEVLNRDTTIAHKNAVIDTLLSTNRSLWQDNVVLFGYYKIYKSNPTRSDFFVWDAKTNRAYYSSLIHTYPKKIEAAYKAGVENGFDLNKWMYFPYWETDWGMNKSKYRGTKKNDSLHTYSVSRTGAIGLVQVQWQTGKAMMEKEYGRKFTKQEVIELLFVDSINIKYSCQYISEFGLNYYYYVMGPPKLKWGT